jgi:hypothetical protein
MLPPPSNQYVSFINPLNAELNPICHLLALGAHHIFNISRIRVNSSLKFLHPSIHYVTFILILIIKTNKMHYFSNVLWYRTQHVSDRFTLHHQESCLFIQLRTAALRLIVGSGLDVPTFTTRRLHASPHESTQRQKVDCGREMSGNFA